MIKLNRNCCDGIYNSIDLHFTKSCDNKCIYCIDHMSEVGHQGKPDVEAIMMKIRSLVFESRYFSDAPAVEDVLILGGEPLLYMDELIEVCQKIRLHTGLKIYITTSLPPSSIKDFSNFRKLMRNISGLNISIQHYNPVIADKLRGHKGDDSSRLQFIETLPKHIKRKVRINLNLIKGYLDTKSELDLNIKFFHSIGIRSIKISELQHCERFYVSYESIVGSKLKSPYATGCQTKLDPNEFGISDKMEIILKRSCFRVENSLKASIPDLAKSIVRLWKKPKLNNFFVVYGDGTHSKNFK